MIETSLFKMLLPLVGSLIALSAFLAFLLIKIPKTYALKFVGIPALLLYAYFSYTFYGNILGRAVPFELPQKFVLLGYAVKDTKHIDVWINEQGETRLYVIPNTPSARTKLQRAMNIYKKTGVPQVGERKSKKEKGRSIDGEFDTEFYQFNFERQMPKTNPPQQVPDQL